MIDIRDLRPTSAPLPLLPDALRHIWAKEALPHWLCSEMGVPDGSTISALGSDYWLHSDHLSTRGEHFLKFLVSSRKEEISAVRCVHRDLPIGLEIADIPFGTRSRNGLRSKGLLDDPKALASCTFGDLFKIPGLGVKSVLEIATLLDAAIAQFERISSEYTTSGKEGKGANLMEGLADISKMYWADQISERDPRFRPLMVGGMGTIQERIDRALLDPDSLVSVANLPALVANIEHVKSQVSRIETLSIEGAFAELLAGLMGPKAPISNGPRLEAMLLRFGWSGENQATLEECGKRLGITRERVRQIEEKILARLPPHPTFFPQIDRALTLLETNTPLPIEKAARLLQDKKISKSLFSIPSLLEAAKLLGRTTLLEIREIKQQKMLIAGPHATFARHAVDQGRRLAGQSGVASIFQIADSLAELGMTFEESALRSLLHNMPTFEFLDEDWFWVTDIPAGRNRLCNVTKKILSVASPQALRTLREGVRRHYHYRAASNARYRSLAVPPLLVMALFYKRHPEFRIEGEMLSAVNPLDYHRELGPTEQAIVAVFRSSPAGVLDRKTLLDACLARGLNEATTSLFATYSPIVEHVSKDIWKLRGVQIDPTAVEALREQNQLRPREKRVLQYGWTTEGKLWIAARAPRHSTSFVIGVPSAVKRYIAGKTFEAISKDSGRSCGQISVNEQGASFGYGPFLRHDGVDEGDILLAEFDLPNHSSTLSVADEAVLDDELQP